MSRLVARAESWERVYSAFQNINFAAFDFNTIKQSILDYIKLYFPETFNDFIESSEFIAIIEVFAYIAELLAYRIDINAHENFISTAQRKDSILRLAKFISYTTSRPLPARGLVKITAVSTSESVVDANGVDLANKIIRWNDVSNTNWKDQFILVMNRVLEQEFGSVGPTDRFQLQDVLFELYAIDMVSLPTGVFKYSAKVNGQSVPMELVPVAYDTSTGIIERRPANNSNFTLVYGQDGLGDASDTTGFFCFTKQGTLQRFRTTFDGVTPNQTYDINADNVNDIDVWVNRVDATTGETTDVDSVLPYRTEALSGKSGEWVEVDLAHAQNVIFNTNPKRNKYELETLVNNRLRVIFGDGEFADVPSGTFDFWVRASLDRDVVIPQSSVVNTQSTFTYNDTFGRTQTFTIQYSLIGSLQNASASEDIEHVRANAPSVYYSQDRMVNGEDYNVFMLQDPSIMRLRAVNRTFAGDSKYIAWHDPSTTYENVKIYGDDGILYFQDLLDTTNTNVVDVNTLITTYVEPLLSSTDLFMQINSANVPISSYRRVFTSAEKTRLVEALTPPPTPAKVDMYYNKLNYQWYALKSSDDPVVALSAANVGHGLGWPSAFITTPLITINQTSIFETRYSVARSARRLMFGSPTTSFWNTNSSSRVVEYDALNSDYDEINVLQANVNCNRSNVLQQNWGFRILGLSTIDSGSDIGLNDVNRVSIITIDTDNTGVPPGLNVEDAVTFKGIADIVKPKFKYSLTALPNTLPLTGVNVQLPIYFWDSPTTNSDVTVYDSDGAMIPRGLTTWDIPSSVNTTNITNMLTIYGKGTNSHQAINDHFTITVNEYVYQTRASTAEQWIDVSTTADNIYSYTQDALAGTGLWRRFIGRSNINFNWMHRSPRYHLVDPAPSNIVDTFIIPKGYYLALKRWLEDPLATKPDLPTPLDLRTSYGYLLDNKMISDTVILHPGKIKLLFGSRAQLPLQATFKIVKSTQSTLTDNQIKTAMITKIRNFFDVTYWEFGETFYFTELAAAIHAALPTDISSVVLVPAVQQNAFGTLFQVLAREDEIFYADVTPDQIEIVTSYTALNMQVGQSTTVVKYVDSGSSSSGSSITTGSGSGGTGTNTGTTYTAMVSIPSSGVTQTGFSVQMVDAPPNTIANSTVESITNGVAALVGVYQTTLGAHSDVSAMGTLNLTNLQPGKQYRVTVQFDTSFAYTGGSSRSIMQTTAVPVTYTAMISVPAQNVTSTGFTIQTFDAPPNTHVTGSVVSVLLNTTISTFDVLLGAHSIVSSMGDIVLTGLQPSTQYMVNLNFDTAYAYNGGSMRSTVQTTAVSNGGGAPVNAPVLSAVTIAPTTANIGDTVNVNIVFTGDDGLSSPSPSVSISAVGLSGDTGVGVGYGYGVPGGWYPSQHILIRPFVVTAAGASVTVTPYAPTGGSAITATLT